MAFLRRGHQPLPAPTEAPAAPVPPAPPSRQPAVPPITYNPNGSERRPEVLAARQAESDRLEKEESERRAAERQALAQRAQDEQRTRGERLHGAEAVAQATTQLLRRSELAWQGALNGGSASDIHQAAAEMAAAEVAAERASRALAQARRA